MTWATAPYAVNTTSVSMTATTASDTSGVQYYFACISGSGHDSGWLDSATYTDTGLLSSTEYTYQVKARDKSVNANETASSDVVSALTTSPGNTKNILLTGYWPPSNEMLRKFSNNPTQNPAGWQGQNWEGRGYDIYAYFPEFPGGTSSNPKGSGDFEIDYQDVSSDFWRITAEIHPIAILSFGQGSGPWEIEYNARNLSSWSSDYLSPTQPTPVPPDSSVATGYVRNSTLPVQAIADAINASGLGINAWVDWSGNPGAFLCEYMAYHDMWYQSLHSSPDDQYQCIAAGFTHVAAGLNVANLTTAVEIALRTTTDYLDSQLLPHYTLTVDVIGNGSVQANPDQEAYDPNTAVTLTATPNSGATFTGWTGDVNIIDNPLTIIMDTDKYLTANFIGGSNPVGILGSWTSGTSHTAEIGANRLLIFTAHAEDDTTALNLSSVTYGGQPMTKVIERNTTTTGYRSYVVAYILGEDGISKATSGTFAVTWAHTPYRVPSYSSVFLANVDQAAPIGASAGNTGTSATLTTSALATANGDMVILAGTNGNTGSYSVNNSFTKAIELTVDSGDGVCGYKPATGAAETPSITHSYANRQVLVGFTVQGQ
jgi:pyrrolidone-carboxylate peptidase